MDTNQKFDKASWEAGYEAGYNAGIDRIASWVDAAAHENESFEDDRETTWQEDVLGNKAEALDAPGSFWKNHSNDGEF